MVKERVLGLRGLFSIGKRILKKSTLKRILSLGDPREQKILYEYSIKAALEFKYAELIKKISLREKEEHHFILFAKGKLLGSKIHFFNATFQRKDFKKIEQLFREIEKEMKP